MGRWTEKAGCDHVARTKSDAGSQNLGRQVGRGIQAPSIPFPTLCLFTHEDNHNCNIIKPRSQIFATRSPRTNNHRGSTDQWIPIPVMAVWGKKSESLVTSHQVFFSQSQLFYYLLDQTKNIFNY